MKPICFLMFVLLSSLTFANDTASILGIWTCSKKDCKVEIYQTGNTYEAKLLWSKQEIDKNGNYKLDSKNPDPAKRKLPVIGSKTLWNATYNPKTGYFENATAYRNGRYFCGKFKLNKDGSLSVLGYHCSYKFLKFSESWTKIK